MRTLWVSVCLMALGCSLLWAQAVSTAQISGVVRDPAGAAVPGASVRVTETDTGLERTAATDTNGAYTLNNLPVGPYTLRVSHQGFSTFVQTGIVLQVDNSPTINPILHLGAQTTTVEVNAAATMVQSQTTDVGQVVDQKTLTNLPLLNRQAINLVFLSGVATPTAGFNDLNTNKNIPTVTFSVAGGLPNGMVYLLDGGTYNDPFNNLNLPLPFPDALQEFKVETSAMPAQYGEHASAVVNAVTKSGTNHFHGDVFEYVRNYSLNARDFFQSTRDSLKQNQFGGVIGGPILTDRLFFFGGFQGTVARSNPSVSNGTFVPTQAMLNGDFSTYASAACQGKAVTLAAPFVNNQISPTQFNQVALNVLKHIPLSTDPAGCGRIPVALPNNTNEYQEVGRVDYTWSANNSLYGRYIIDHYSNPVATGAAATANALLSSKTGQANQDQSFTLGDTYIFSPDTSLASHATVLRDSNSRFPSQFFSALDVGVNPNNFHSLIPLFTNISVGGGFSVGSSEPGYWNQTVGQLAEDFTMVRGSHQIQFGVDWIHEIMNSLSTAAANGNFSFSTGPGSFTGLGLSDFLLGDLSGFTQANSQLEDDRANYIGVYAQDSWTIRPGLSLNYGLRWEPYLPQQNSVGHASIFSVADFQAGIHSTVYPQGPAGMLFPGDPGFPGKADTFGKLAVFAPRVGLVWQVGGSGGTTVRAAYGIFNDAPQMFYTVRFGSNAPWGPSDSFSITTPGAFSDPWAASNQPGGISPPFPNGQFFPTGGGAAYVTEPLHMQPMYLQQWNLSLERQIGTNLLISATYLGNETTHLLTGQELDPSVYIPGNCTANGNFPAPYSNIPNGLAANGPCTQIANLPNRQTLFLMNPAQGTYYGTMGLANPGGTASYNALLFSVQRRLASNLSGFANWTWSHCISDPPSLELTGPTYINPNNRRADRGNCSSDRRNVINIALVANSPAGGQGWAGHLLSGWRLSPIFRFQTGNYVSVALGGFGPPTAFSDPAGTGIRGQRAVQVLSNPFLPNPGVNGYLNYAAFAAPAAGALPPASGAMGPYSIENPDFTELDASLSRTFAMGESRHMELRWDVFNVPNLVNLPGPSTALANRGTFGKIIAGSSVGGPRIMQLAVKYVF